MANKGYIIVKTLKKVVDGGPDDGEALDVNNNLTADSGLPQATKANVDGDPDYVPQEYDTDVCIVNPFLLAETYRVSGISDEDVCSEDDVVESLFTINSSGVVDVGDYLYVLDGSDYVPYIKSTPIVGGDPDFYWIAFQTSSSIRSWYKMAYNSVQGDLIVSKGVCPIEYLEFSRNLGVKSFDYLATDCSEPTSLYAPVYTTNLSGIPEVGDLLYQGVPGSGPVLYYKPIVSTTPANDNQRWVFLTDTGDRYLLLKNRQFEVLEITLCP